MKRIVGCQLIIDNLQVWYNNGDCKHIKKADLLTAIQLMDDFEYVKEMYGIDCIISYNRNNPNDLLHLLSKAQTKILKECQEINKKYPDLNLSKITEALRHFKK